MSTIHISMCSPVLIRLYTHVFTYVCMYVHMCTLFNTCSFAHSIAVHLLLWPMYTRSCCHTNTYTRLCAFTGHTNTCTSDHCTPVSISGVHPFCHVRKLVRMFTRDCAYELARICTSFVSTCSCVRVYVCSYIHMFTCTQLLICSRVHLYIGPSWLRAYLLTYVHMYICHHMFQTLFPSSERKAGVHKCCT